MKKNTYVLAALGSLASSVIGQNVYPPTGNVGIGTTTPVSTLHVAGNATVDGEFYLMGNETSGSRFISNRGLAIQALNNGGIALNPFDGGGDVGVGKNFHVAGYASVNGNLILGGTSAIRGAIELGDSAVAGINGSFIDFHGGVGRPDEDFNIRLANDVDRMLLVRGGGFLVENGNVGIGTITPGQRLSVVGVIQSLTGGFMFPDGSIQITAAQPGSGTLPGTAGGDLTGSYPNPSIRNGAVNTSKIADKSVTDAKVNSVSWTKIFGQPTSFPPNGVAGGHLTGTYPNPAIASGVVGSSQLASDSASLAKISAGLMSRSSTNVSLGGTLKATGQFQVTDNSGNVRLEITKHSLGAGTMNVYSANGQPISVISFPTNSPDRGAVSVLYNNSIKAAMYVNPSGNGVITATTISQSSDRNLKEGFIPVNARETLEKISSLPISRWRFKGDTEVHVGPMAQDFYDAFGLGADDKHITTVDAQGIAFAAIQGLNDKLDAENAALRAENAALKARFDKLEQSVERIGSHRQ